MTLFSNWINKNSVSDEYLALFRISFASFFILFSGMVRFDALSEFPSFFYRPPASFASLFDSFPPAWFFHGFNILLPLLAFLILIGFKTFWSSLLFGITFILAYSFYWAFGSINHYHLVPFTAIIFSFSRWGTCFSVDSYLKKNQLSLPKFNVLPFYALILSFSYFSSGLSKILGGWLNPDYQATYFQLINNYYFNERKVDYALILLKIDSTYFWEFLDYLICFIEISPLLFLFNSKKFKLSLVVLAFFHLFVYLVMGISFGYYPLFFCILLLADTKVKFIDNMSFFLKKKLDQINRFRILIFLFGLYFFYLYVMYFILYENRFLDGFPIEFNISLFISVGLVCVIYFHKKESRKL